MASTFMTLADLTKINSNDISDIDVSDLLDEAPLLQALGATLASNGDVHKYVKETTAPTVGFRAANAGRAHSASGDTSVTVTLKILDASFTVDKALADIYKGGPEALLAREAKRHLKAAFFMAESQLIYGTGAEAGGFAAMADSTALDALADAMVIGAGGTGSDCSSVWAIRTNNDGRDCEVIIGADGEINIGESNVQVVLSEAAADTYYPAYVTPISGWMGLQLGSAYSIGRLANVDSAGAGLMCSDAHIASLLELFPASRPPTLLLMSKRSRKQLQQSRTATNATGAPAPFPTEAFGVPIITSDAVLDTETAIT